MRDQDDGRAEPLLQIDDELQDLGLDRHVERSRRLVGDQHLRIAGERHRDHDALAHAAGQLMRVFLDALLRLGNADEFEHLDRALDAPARGSCPWWRMSASEIWRPTVITGLSDVIGSWKIIEMSLPRMSRICVFVELQGDRALEFDRAVDDAARRIWDQAQQRERRNRLAAARFADDCQRFTGVDVRRTRRRRP